MFGDILMWVLTVFGLIPMLKALFGPKKTFQEQLAEFSDDVDDGHGDAGWDQFGVDLESGGSGEFRNDDDAEAARFFQEIGECGSEYRRFSMLEDFWLPRDDANGTRTGPRL